MKKSSKKFLAVIIVLSMVFTSHAFVTFAENFENVSNEMELEKEKDESFDIESEVKNDNDEEDASETRPYSEVSEENVGASSTSPEDETSEENVGASSANPEDETSEENVGASSTSPEEIVEPEAEEPEEDETDYPEEPEEDETEATVEASEVVVGASSTSPEEETSNSEETAETEIEVETEDKLFGATNKYLSYIDISQYTKKTYYVGDTYDPSDLKIKAYYEDADTGEEEWVEVAYIDDKSKFSFSPDCVNSPFTASTTEENPYELTITYDDGTNDPFCTQLFQVHPATTTTYTVQYNQNLPSGYSLSDGKTWYADATTDDLSGDPIELEGNADMTCEDASGNVRTLQGWNTYSSGAGSSYSFGASINTDAGFAGYTLTLYAMWSDPVAPTTGFMYWKVDGDDNNKTIHYYASPGEGRAAVVIGTNGVEHTSLGSSDREKIKYAVFEDNIAATNLESCFENFKGLESITNLRKLDTSNVTSMRQMFMSAGVKELDLTNFETSNVTDMYGMFSSCENLETIRVSDKFVVDKVSTSNGKFMFSGCEKLVGEKGTKFTDTATPWGKSYAHIDEGSTNPGLFSGASTPTPPTPPTPAKTIDSISVLSHNTNTITADGATFLPAISQGETFDLNGMVLKVTYNDGSTSTVTYNSTTASQFTISDNGAGDPSTITIGYGGKQTTYDYYVQSTPDFYIYINDPASNKKVGFTYIQISAGMIESIYDNLAGSNATGFYVINATGLKDAWNKYNKNAAPTMTKEQARAAADAFNNPLSQDIYWGITYGNTNPGSNSKGKNNGGDSSSDSGDASPTEGPMGDLTKDPEYADKLVNRDVNTENNIPQSSLLKNDALVTMLKSLPENSSTPYTNAKDQYGNTGFGQWLNVPGTTTWYFNTGNLNGNSGLLRNGWYNLGWRGVDEWYHFDSNGVMDIGWYEEDGKTYYLLYDFSNHWYGKVVTGTQVINGQVYNFDSNGVLII